MDRKYSHRGYRDAERDEKKDKNRNGNGHHHDRKPPSGGPRNADQFGPRTPRMVGTVTRARCSNCGTVLNSGFDPNGKCPKCGSRAPLLQAVPLLRFRRPVRVHAAHPRTHHSQRRPQRMQILRIPHHRGKRYRPHVLRPENSGRRWCRGGSLPPAPPRHNDARQAFENLFKK